MNHEAVADDVEFASAPKVDRSAVAIRDNLTRVESALTEFDKISAGLEDLRTRFPIDLVYDVTTTKGMAEAVAHRAAWREPRINVEKFRKTAKAPVLALGKDIDTRAAWLTEQLLEGENPVHEQIKVEEGRKEEARQAKIAAEFGRVSAIHEAISEIHLTAQVAAGKPSAAIAEELAKMRAASLEPVVFQELLPQAQAAQQAAIGKLELAHKAKLHEEAEAARIAAERAELEQLRAAAAEQKRKDEVAAAEARRVEAERLAGERAAVEEEQRAARARIAQEESDARAKRVEAERVAAAERAELRKTQDEADAKERAARLAKEERERTKRLKAEAADKQLRDAAPVLLAALQGLLTRHGDGSTEAAWAEWDTARDAVKAAGA